MGNEDAGRAADHMRPPDHRSPAYLVSYLIVTTWAIYAYANVFFMIVPYLTLKGFSPEFAGILVGGFYAATTLARPLGGWVAERAGIRLTMIVSAVLCFAVALFMFGASSFRSLSFWSFLSIRLAMGCTYGVFVVALTTYQSLAISEETRGGSFALITLGSLGCLFTVVPFADWLLTNGHTLPFLAVPVFMAGLCVLLSFRLPLLAKDANDLSEAGTWGTWGELFRDTPAGRMAASCFLFGLCDASIVYLPALALAMGLVPSSFMVANGLGALATRIWGRNFFNRRPRYVFAGPSLVVMASFLYLSTLAANNLWFFICGFFNGVGMGYGYPAHLTLIGDLAPSRLRAKSSALVYFCCDASWFVLPVYVGFATPAIGEIWAFKLLALFSVVSGVGVTAMWTLYAKRR
jgi:MFS family permease